MEKKDYYKYMFIIGAIWNLFLAVPMFTMSFFDASGFSGASLMYYQGFMMAVILFGIGYLIVGLNLDDNHAIILLGIIGKVLLFVFFLSYYLLGYIPFYTVIMGVVDLIFSILFIEFLMNYKKIQE